MLRGAVHVVEAVADMDGHLHFGRTKTYANRRVPMPPFLVDELAGYLAERPSEPESLVFTAPEGGPLRHNNFYRRKSKPAVKRASLPNSLRFHDLRHTYAAFCIASTADPYLVMRRMGHSSITVTYNTYGHLFPERDDEVTAGLEALWRRRNADPRRTRTISTGRSVPSPAR